ncbi:cytochrome-c peroxidase [Ferruginibacter sp. HRS2-29]|uniref:cytochrome-c peroxidase n=1 Tax=Ferruginibacter sp. HRS2-29 TaxID=2487334 RepID=UPI0020CDE2AB|nr:cytochrome-c peroxidase [Ferruginibacter sp. HRS2-29]MCP9752950.1 cytochrome-c peroxidase [Ferruginibacter sp. HRS2-29]
MKKLIIISTLVFFVSGLQFCSKSDTAPVADGTELKPVLPSTVFDYVVTYPAHVQAALTANDNTPADNPITNDGATLGRVLFYDKQLSKDNKVSCGSCHKQQFSFDDNVALSAGVDGGLTTRNSMAILNVRFYKGGKMFWDERAATLEKQALQPIQNHVEMDLTLAQLETKVNALSYYPALFQKAFGSTLIDSVRIAKALSQFERSIVTYQSKYDRVKQGLATFTAAEAQGEQLFLNAAAPNTCASCHTPPMFITSMPNAPFALLDAADLGINNENRFKSGSLRNIGTRTKLFHNGRIENLQAMLTPGGPGAPPPIPNHTVAQQDVQNMLAFLNTLTDNTITTEAKFSNPFP